MATRTSVGSGLWSAAGTWNTGVPVDGDTAIIATGHDVEFDVDQTAFATGVTVTITGTLHASTTAGSYVLKLAAAMTGTGTLRAGTSGTPYPTNCTFEIVRNGFQITATGMALDINCSEPTTKYIRLSGAEAAGQTILSVDTDVTTETAHWKDGAIIRIDDVNGQDSEERIIAAGGVAANAITVTAALTNAKITGALVILISRNVKITHTANTGTAINGTPTANSRIFAEIRGVSYGANVVGCTIGGSVSSISTIGISGSSNVISSVISSSSLYGVNTFGCVYNGAVISGCSSGYVNTGNVSLSVLISGCSNGIQDSAGESLILSTINGCGNSILRGAGYKFTSCTFSNNTSDLTNISGFSSYNSLFSSATEFSGYNGTLRDITAFAESIDHDQVSGAYKAWCRGGIVTTQAVVFPTGYTTSQQHALESATYYCFQNYSITVPAGGGLVVQCYARKDASMSYLPRVWILLPGIEPLISGSPSYEAIMTNSVDTWETLALVYANATTAPVTVTVRTVAQNATGNAYFYPINTVLAPATYDVYNTLQADIDDIQTRIPAALVGGRMDTSVGAMAANTLTASALATDAVTEIQAGLSTLTAQQVWEYVTRTLTASGDPTAVAIADAVLSRGVSNVENTADLASLTELILAALESSRTSTTWTIRKTGGTTFNTKTLTLDASAQPVTGST